MEADALAVIQAVDNAKTMMQQQEEELKSITAQFAEVKKKLTDIKTVVVDVENELRKCEVSFYFKLSSVYILSHLPSCICRNKGCSQ